MDGRDDRDVQQLAGIALIAFLLAVGLLACVPALPLHWQPGQIPALVAALIIAPAVTAAAQWRAAQQAMPAARATLGRARMGILALIALAAVVAPALGWQAAHPAGDWLNVAFLAPVALGAALSWLAAGSAGSLASRWAALHPQTWETGAANERAALWSETTRQGRVNRTEILGTLWRDWGGGAIALALALLVARWHGSPGTGWGLAAFVGYLLLGPLLIGRAAHLRWQSQWQLDRLDVEGTVGADWAMQSLWPVLGVVLGAALLPAAGFLTLANALVLWIAAILAPILDRLLTWVGGLFHFNVPSISSALHAATHPASRPPAIARPSAARPARPPHVPDALVWLGQHWYLVVGICALLPLLAALARTGATGTRIARARMLALALLRGLRALFQAARRPIDQWAAQAGKAARSRAAALGVRRRRGRIDPARMAPRQAVIALYLAALGLLGRRAGARRPAQTPEEYARQTAARHPELHQQLEGMTALFTRARYGPAPVEEAERGRMQALWSALRGALRRIPRGERKA